MKKLNKKIKNKRIIWLIIFLFWIISMFGSLKAQDLLEQAFKPSMVQNQVIDLWNTKEAVWNEVLREWVEVEIDLRRCKNSGGQPIKVTWNTKAKKKADCDRQSWIRTDFIDVNTTPPLIVRIAKVLLRITIVLSITMVLYNGILYIIQSASWKEVSQLEAKNNLLYVGWGLLLALCSLAIINLMSSVWLSTLQKTEPTSTTTQDAWDTTTNLHR